MSKVKQVFRELASRRCEEILRGYNIEKRRDICNKLSEIKRGLSPEAVKDIDKYVEEMNIIEADKEEYLYVKAFLEGFKLGQEED